MCVSSVASSLSLTLSFSPCSICASVTRQRGDPWANAHLRCSAASLLTRLSWGSGVCRLLCSLWPTQPMAGQAANRTGLSEWWARPLRCVSGASVRGGLFGLDGFVFFRRCRSDVRGSTPGNKGHGGRSLRWEEGGARWRFREWVYLHHGNQLDCQSHAATVCGAHSPLLHVTKRRGVQHLLRCIVGPVVVQTKKKWGGDCMHSHLSGGASEKLVVVC